ncbi:MAG: PAS domain S-box protein [Bacteroidetes bacterium]|jgi:PAS domain S-box-containing protein|nr:PAS domain S-box protein [Bacteroidota bacterium]
MSEQDLNKQLLTESNDFQEANLRAIFENTDTAYVLFNTDFVIMSFNSLAQKYSQEQNDQTLIVGNSVRDYFSAERWPIIKNTLEKVSKGETIAYEISNTDASGVVKWFNVRWLNVKDDDGQNRGFILANKEITEAKNAELEREKITADLIQHDKDLEQFTYIISHNLRAPVANILGLSDMMRDHDLDNEAKMEVFDRVVRSIENIDMVIKDLNQVLQAREMLNAKQEVIYFDNIIEAFKASIHDVVLNEKVQFKYNFDEVESVFCIPSYINSIFYNLLSNSIKYRKPGVSPIITVKSRKLPDKIELHFKDNGKGIDLEKHGRHVFGMYKRFDTSVAGKGLGLFMVKTQVEALGGTIKIKSKPGVGTEFIIQSPIRDSH